MVEEKKFGDEFHLSKSRLLCYINCPFQYKLRYISQVPQAEVPVYERGKAVHDILEKFWSKFYVTNIKNPEDQFRKILQELARDKWLDYSLFLENFLKFEVKRWNSFKTTNWRMKYFKPVNNEMDLRFGDLVGIVDRLDYHPKKGYRILDYKTGGTTSIDKNMFELSLYAYLVHANFDIRATRVAILNLKNGKLYEGPVTMVDIGKALKIMNRVRNLIACEIFDKPRNPNCWFCPQNYKQICKKLNKKQEAKDYLEFKKGD